MRKIYEALPDSDTALHKQVRVIDEFGDDYLYPEEYFVLVSLPRNIEQAVIKAA